MPNSACPADTVTSAPWRPRTRIETELADAAIRGDQRRYLAVLASADLYVYLPKADVDAGRQFRYSVTESRAGAACVAVRTAGERYPRRQRFVTHRTSLAEVAATWPDPRISLLVNPGTPAELTLRAARWQRARWSAAVRRSPSPAGDERGHLVTRLDGPHSGPEAHALACGAHLAVRNSVPWNEIGDAYNSYVADRLTLSDSWDVTDHARWRTELDALLEARNSPSAPAFVLRVRRELVDATGELISAETWRQACGEAIGETSATLERLIGRIGRYEARFRADGLLPAGGFVRRVEAYDYGRAVNFARWGLGARLCDADTAHAAVLLAGARSAAAHTSWQDFSAGYALGRVLRFDEDDFGIWYATVLAPHRLLASAPDSPWLTLDWPDPGAGTGR